MRLLACCVRMIRASTMCVVSCCSGSQKRRALREFRLAAKEETDPLYAAGWQSLICLQAEKAQYFDTMKSLSALAKVSGAIQGFTGLPADKRGLCRVDGTHDGVPDFDRQQITVRQGGGGEGRYGNPGSSRRRAPRGPRNRQEKAFRAGEISPMAAGGPPTHRRKKPRTARGRRF